MRSVPEKNREVLKDVKSWKTGTDYVTIKLPKRILKKIPDGYFYFDLIIETIRGGKKNVSI